MKTHKLLLAAGAGLLVAAHTSTASTLYDDTFGDGVEATNPDVGGGYTYQDNANGTSGSVTETGGQAQITDGTSFNSAGIRSINDFDLSDSGLSYTVTWDVAQWAPSGNTATNNRLFFALQTDDGFLFTADPEESRLYLILTPGTDQAIFEYNNRSGGSNNATNENQTDLTGLTGDADGFTVTLTLDATGYTATTTGLDAANQVNISGVWGDLSTDFATVFGTDGNMHVASYIQDPGATGSEFDINQVTLTAVPEPGSLALLGLGGLLVARRRRR